MKTKLPPELLSELVSSSPDFRELLLHVANVAAAIFHHGWAEANAGNLSIDISDMVTARYPESNGHSRWFLVSKTGCRFREMMHCPQGGLMIIQQGQNDQFYGVSALPTSEWPCHKALHLADIDRQYPCILHSHSTEIIALSNTPLINAPDKLNALLPKLLPELSSYLPQGIAIAAPAPPGSVELAKCSVEAIGNRQILIWPAHGLLCRAKDIDTALDLMEIVNKAASIYFLTRT